MTRESKSKPNSDTPDSAGPTPAVGVPGDRSADLRSRIVDTALSLAETRNWSRLTLSEIAEESGISLAELHRNFTSKNEILETYFRSVDQMTLAGAESARGSIRDRLFDVVMCRFDALSPRRHAILAILNDLRSDPATALSLLPGFWRSLTWIVEAAGASPVGLRGLALRKGLAVVYLNAFRVWIDDDSPSLDRTMAALDKGLRYSERLVAMFGLDDRQEELTRQEPEPSDATPSPSS